jgi:diguanylate cyclase (GGDEF)-like protein
MLDPRWRRLARLRLYGNASCIASVAIGGLVLCGWILRVPLLKSALLGSASMEVNTALGLVFLGASLWLLLPDPPRRAHRAAGLFLGALVACIGALTIVEYALGVDLRIDQLLFNNGPAAIAGRFTGRMPPVTAVTFFVLGVALFLLDSPRRLGTRAAQLLSLSAVFAATMSLNGYINSATAIYGLFSYTPMAVFTALVLLMMGVAIFFARPRVGIAGDLTGKFVGSTMARRFVPLVIIIPILGAWIRMQCQRAGLFGAELGYAWSVTVNVVALSLLVWFNARKLNRAEESLEALRHAKNMLYDASLRDELTGLYNRRGFLAFAEEQLKLACSGRRELLVVFADVDGLKAINDGYGHSAGDLALKKAAEVLVAVFRDTDILARLGGDEFAVLALDCSPVGLVRINAHFDKMLRMVNDMDTPWKLSISIGTVHIDSQHQHSITELLSKADTMMYRQKREKVSADVLQSEASQ